MNSLDEWNEEDDEHAGRHAQQVQIIARRRQETDFNQEEDEQQAHQALQRSFTAWWSWPLLRSSMPRKKLTRFAELKTLPNVYEFPQGLAGQWHDKVFQNSQPIVLELACGAGDYVMGLAPLFPGKNFIGVDIQGERLWYGAKSALEKQLNNAIFIRTDINQLAEHFGKEEIAEMWITFADPHPRTGNINKRLTSAHFINIYRQILQPGALVHLKTDSDLLYQYTLAVIKAEKLRLEEQQDDVYATTKIPAELNIQTYYEKQHLAAGKTIKYLCFTL